VTRAGHHGLQRALVVAMHDPGFAAALARDPDGALAPFGLGSAERAELAAIDPRAFAVDRLRGRRLLGTLVGELRASVAIALAEVRRLGFLEGFLAGPEFRAAVAADRSLVLALGGYLAAARAAGRLTSPALDGVLALELARARARRDLRRRPGPGVALAPGLAVVATTAGALDALARIEQHLFELGLVPHLALVEDPPPFPALPPVDGPSTWLLARATGDDVGFEALEPPLARALEGLATATAAGAIPPAAAIAALGGLGLPVSRPGLLLDELIAAGLVVRG
jgi:hypothetical protein